MELTTGPLDRVETRGFLAADTMGSTEVSTLDAAKVGKRVQERAGIAKQEQKAAERKVDAKVSKVRAAAVNSPHLAGSILEQTVAGIRQAAADKILEHDMQSGEYAAAEDMEFGVLRSDAEQWLDHMYTQMRDSTQFQTQLSGGARRVLVRKGEWPCALRLMSLQGHLDRRCKRGYVACSGRCLALPAHCRRIYVLFAIYVTPVGFRVSAWFGVVLASTSIKNIYTVACPTGTCCSFSSLRSFSSLLIQFSCLCYILRPEYFRFGARRRALLSKAFPVRCLYGRAIQIP